MQARGMKLRRRCVNKAGQACRCRTPAASKGHTAQAKDKVCMQGRDMKLRTVCQQSRQACRYRTSAASKGHKA
eukprot:1160402-Pelagomonas_calceolata.AAC.6